MPDGTEQAKRNGAKHRPKSAGISVAEIPALLLFFVRRPTPPSVLFSPWEGTGTAHCGRRLPAAAGTPPGESGLSAHWGPPPASPPAGPGLRLGVGLLKPGGQGRTRQAPDGALPLDVGGGRAVFVQRRLLRGEVRRQQVDGSKAPLLVAAKVQRRVQRPQGGLRSDARLEKLL